MTHAVFPLPKITYPLSIGTLGLCLATGHEITMDCSKCNNHRRLNLVKLARHIGPDHGSLAHDLRPHVWCTECGAWGEAISFSVHAPIDRYSNVDRRCRGKHVDCHGDIA